MIRVTLQVDERSDALAALDRLALVDCRTILGQMQGVVQEEVRRTFRASWRNHRKAPVNSVYRAVKQAVLDNTGYGILTGSSSRAIRADIVGDSIIAGFTEQSGTWPLSSYEKSAPMSSVAKALGGVWDLSKGERAGYQRKWARLRSLDKASGSVTVSWDSSGFHIKWPALAQKLLWLKDVDIAAEAFVTKKYGKAKESSFFVISKQFADQIFNGVARFYGAVVEGSSEYLHEFDVSKAQAVQGRQRNTVGRRATHADLASGGQYEIEASQGESASAQAQATQIVTQHQEETKIFAETASEVKRFVTTYASQLSIDELRHWLREAFPDAHRIVDMEIAKYLSRKG